MTVQKVFVICVGFAVAAAIAGAAGSFALGSLLLVASYATFFAKAPNAEWDHSSDSDSGRVE